MNVQDLVQWLFEFDFDYWAIVCFLEGSEDSKYLRETFEEEVYDTIDDEVRHGCEYKDYILHEEGPFDD